MSTLDEHVITPVPEVLLIGGRSGVGKSTVAWEVSSLLQRLEIAHCAIEGDFLDQIHPAPKDDPARTKITERNLAAIWNNYRELGHHRLIYTNTVSVLEADMVVRAMGGNAKAVRILLVADDQTAAERLGGREIGSELGAHIERSNHMAQYIEARAPAGTVRIGTVGKSVSAIAEVVVGVCGWRSWDALI